MPRTIKIITITIFLATFFGIAPSFSCVLRAGSEAPYPPFQILREDDSFSGIEIELLLLIGQEIGCHIDLVAMPWARILRSIETGVLEVAMNALEKPERAIYAWFSDSYLQVDARFFVRKLDAESYKINELADLLKFPGEIGIVNGYSYGKDFDLLVNNNPNFAAQLTPAKNFQTNLLMLAKGRINGFIGQDVPVLALAQELNLKDQISVVGPIFDRFEYRFMLSRATVTEGMVMRINQSLKNLREQGSILRIIKKYY
ncbi:polar amino acid transport system substrate-binding protein [Azospirillaceae bacterium]